MSKNAWVTLATNDSYSLGALVVAHSLKRVHTAHQLVVLVTPSVSDSMRGKLASVFDLVESVNVLDSQDSAHLALLARPELGITFTKLHCWRLTQFKKAVFLDADTLILQNSDELFDREELSAAPDVGWPDCFNSGVFVFKPSLDTYGKLLEFAQTTGSFDGADQGLLNQFFSDWSTKDISKHLPFAYNTTTTACYSYIPAFKKFGENVKILHFIGEIKPWLQKFDPVSKTVQTPSGYGHVTHFLQLWWNIFCDDVHPKLSPEMNNTRPNNGYGVVENSPWYENPKFQYIPPNMNFFYPQPNPNNHNNPNEDNPYDPWESYTTTDNSENNNVDNEKNNATFCYYHPSASHDVVDENHHTRLESNNPPPNVPSGHHTPSSYHESSSIPDYKSYHPQSDSHYQPISNSPPPPPPQPQHPPSNSPHHSNDPSECQLNAHVSNFPPHNTTDNNATTTTTTHPFFNSNNSNLNENENDKNLENDCRNDAIMGLSTENSAPQDKTMTADDESGIAGALSQLKLGESRSHEQDEYETSMRRHCWESGNIDYLGKDSFENIWRTIQRTVESGNKQDIPQATQIAEQSSSAATVVDASKKEVKLTLTTRIHEEEYHTCERNVIAVCSSPHELLRSLSSPGLAQEQIITTVLANGRTVRQKILTFPEREIEIEDTERIEILGPITRTVTTETTRIVAGQQNQVNTEVVVTQLPSDEAPKVDRTLTANVTIPMGVPSPIPEDLLKKGQIGSQAVVPKSPKINIADILEKKPDDKVEYDAVTNTTTITRQTDTGYEVIITSVSPEGRNKIQTKTFFNPIEVNSSEEIEEYEEQHTTTEDKRTVSTTSSTVTSTQQTTQSIQQSSQENKIVPAPKVTPQTEETTTIITTKTKTVTEPAEEIEIIETEETTTAGPRLVREVTTAIPMLSSVPVEKKNTKKSIIDEITQTEINKFTKSTTTIETISTEESVSPDDDQITVVTEKTTTGRRIITTIVKKNGIIKVEIRTIHDLVGTPGVEEVSEEYKEMTFNIPAGTNPASTPSAPVKPSSNPQTVNTTNTSVIDEITQTKITEFTKSTTTVETISTEESISPDNDKITVVSEKTTTGRRIITTIVKKNGVVKVEIRTIHDLVGIPGVEEVSEEYKEMTFNIPVGPETTPVSEPKITPTVAPAPVTSAPADSKPAAPNTTKTVDTKKIVESITSITDESVRTEVIKFITSTETTEIISTEETIEETNEVTTVKETTVTGRRVIRIIVKKTAEVKVEITTIHDLKNVPGVEEVTEEYNEMTFNIPVGPEGKPVAEPKITPTVALAPVESKPTAPETTKPVDTKKIVESITSITDESLRTEIKKFITSTKTVTIISTEETVEEEDIITTVKETTVTGRRVIRIIVKKNGVVKVEITTIHDLVGAPGVEEVTEEYNEMTFNIPVEPKGAPVAEPTITPTAAPAPSTTSAPAHEATPVVVPVEQQPSAPVPVEEKPSVLAPVEQQPSVPAPADGTPAAPVSVDEKPAVPAPAEQQPSIPAPADETPAAPAPIEENPSVPAPVEQQPSVPAPADETAATPAPVDDKPVVPAPAEQQPSAPAPAEQQPSVPAPVDEKPSVPAPIEQQPSVPAPANETPVAPAPVEEKPAVPAPVEQQPSVPAPADETPAAPAPVDDKPVVPAPAEQQPSAPAPVDEKPSVPAPVEQQPSVPAPADETPAAPAPVEEKPSNPSTVENKPSAPQNKKPVDTKKIVDSITSITDENLRTEITKFITSTKTTEIISTVETIEEETMVITVTETTTTGRRIIRIIVRKNGSIKVEITTIHDLVGAPGVEEVTEEYNEMTFNIPVGPDGKPVEEPKITPTAAPAPVAAAPVEGKPLTSAPVDKKPAAVAPVEEKPLTSAPADKKPAAVAPVEEKPVAAKPSAPAPVAKKPAAPKNKKPLDTKKIVESITSITDESLRTEITKFITSTKTVEIISTEETVEEENTVTTVKETTKTGRRIIRIIVKKNGIIKVEITTIHDLVGAPGVEEVTEEYNEMTFNIPVGPDGKPVEEPKITPKAAPAPVAKKPTTPKNKKPVDTKKIVESITSITDESVRTQIIKFITSTKTTEIISTEETIEETSQVITVKETTTTGRRVIRIIVKKTAEVKVEIKTIHDLVGAPGVTEVTEEYNEMTFNIPVGAKPVAEPKKAPAPKPAEKKPLVPANKKPVDTKKVVDSITSITDESIRIQIIKFITSTKTTEIVSTEETVEKTNKITTIKENTVTGRRVIKIIVKKTAEVKVEIRTIHDIVGAPGVKEVTEEYDEMTFNIPVTTTTTTTTTSTAPSSKTSVKDTTTKIISSTDLSNVTDTKTTVTDKKDKKPAVKAPARKVKPTETAVTETTTTTNEIISTEEKVIGDDKVTIVTEKTPTGKKVITTTKTKDGKTRIQTQTFYDSEEEEIEEEYEEEEETTTTTSSAPKSKKDSKTTVTQVDSAVQETGKKVVTKTAGKSVTVTEQTATQQISQSVSKSSDKALEDSSKKIVSKTDGVDSKKLVKKATATQDSKMVATKTETQDSATRVATKTTKVQEERRSSVTTSSKIEISGQVTSNVDKKAITSKADKTTTAAPSKITDKSTVDKGAVKKTTTTTTTTKDKSTTVSKATAPKPTDPNTTVTSRRVTNPDGIEYTYTTKMADGTTKWETKTMYDAVEVPGDEEEYEEIEETEEKLPTVRKTTTTTKAVPVTGSAAPGLKKLAAAPKADGATSVLKKKVDLSANGNSAKDAEAPTAPPRKKEIKKHLSPKPALQRFAIEEQLYSNKG